MPAFQHICINSNNYEEAIHFYCDLLGLTIHSESFSKNKNATKVELYDESGYAIELFVNKDWPVAKEIETRHGGALITGFDHLSFYEDDPDAKLAFMKENGVEIIETQIDAGTGKKYGFCFSPEGLKIEFYEK